METIQTNLVNDVRQRVAAVVVGQDTVVERLLIALFTGGHLLLQGVRGTNTQILRRQCRAAIARDAAVFCYLKRKQIAKIEQLVQRLQLVQAICPLTHDMQEQIQLGGCQPGLH